MGLPQVNISHLLPLQHIYLGQFGEDFLFLEIHPARIFLFLFRKTFYTCRRSRIFLSHCFSHIINGHSQHFQAAVTFRQRKIPPHLHGVRKEALCLAQNGLACVKRLPSYAGDSLYVFTHVFLSPAHAVICLIVFFGREKLASLVQITTSLFWRFS